MEIRQIQMEMPEQLHDKFSGPMRPDNTKKGE